MILLSCNRHTASSGTTYDKRFLLEQIKKSIDEDDNRTGYIQMQKYGEKYISNQDWMDNKVDYLDYASANEIKKAASQSMNSGDFVRAYFLYKLILPEL